MPQPEPDALLSVAQAAALLGVHPNTIRTWTDAGRLTAYRINSRGDRRFRRGDVERLLVEDGVDEQRGRAVEARQARPELSAIRRIATELAAAPTPGSVARTLVEVMRTDLGARHVAVYVAADDELRLEAHGGYRTAPTNILPLDGAAASDQLWATRRDEVPVTLATRRGPVGMLVLDRETAGSLDPTVADAIFSTVTTALASARVLTGARRELRRTRTLTSVARELAGELDLSKVLDDIIQRTRSLFSADRAGLWLLDDHGRPHALVANGLSDRFLAHSAALTPDTPTLSMNTVRDARPRWARKADTDPAVGEMRQAYADEGIATVCVVPLVDQGATIGVIGLYHDTDRTWPDDEIGLVQAFADQAAVAIRNARLYRSVADQAARMRSIQDLSARLNRLTDVRAIGEAIVAEARTLADYHDIRIYRVDRERGVCEPIAFTREMLEGDPADATDLLRVRIGEGFTGWVAENGEPLLINNALDDPRGMTIAGTDDVPESMLVVPMLYEGRALGVIVLSQLGFDQFTEDDLATMRIFGGYAAQAMANATTYEQLVTKSSELAQRADSQRRLLEINKRLLTLDQAGVLEAIADGLRDVVSYDNLSIYRADHVAHEMVPVLAREQHADEVSRYRIPFGRGLMGWAVEHGQSLLANDALADPRALQIPGTPAEPEAIVVVPLVAEGQVLGALNVSRVGGEEVHFSSSDFELIQLFAAQASIALSNADAHDAVSRQAETDALTGLGNHGAFQRDLARHVDAALAAETPAARRLSLLMMDLDNFKAYNDRHGHPAGDALLHRIATEIYGSARSDDRVYRYGGDEFALILPSASAPAAARVAERVRRAVAALTVDDPTPVTITIGVAALSETAGDRAGLIAAADTALYYGKRSGDDRVVRSDRLPADVDDLRGTLDELARTALRETDDEHAVEDFVERASQLGAGPVDDDIVRDALMAVSRALGRAEPAIPGHAERVGHLAVAVATELGMSALQHSDIELAARLHAVDDRAVAALSRVPSMRPVSTLVAGHRRLVAEGRRRGRRAARPQGRVGAHVIGVARIYDALVSGGTTATGRNEALDCIRRDPATWRAEVIEALAAVVSRRRDVGRRQRTTDHRRREDQGAA